MGKKKPEKRGDTMDFTIDWDNLPSMEEERNTCPLKAVSLWKMDKGGLRRLTTTDNFLDMDNYIRDFAATGHNRMKVCVLAAHWKVEENFRGYGVMAVPLRIDRKLEKAENICENTLLHDAMRQCSFIHMEDSNASKDIRHNKAMAASLYNLEGLRETFVREVQARWPHSKEEFEARYTKQERAVPNSRTVEQPKKKTAKAKQADRPGTHWQRK